MPIFDPATKRHACRKQQLHSKNSCVELDEYVYKYGSVSVSQQLLSMKFRKARKPGEPENPRRPGSQEAKEAREAMEAQEARSLQNM
jgi:hypothetical protein